jgi:hypothetical protein
VRNEQQHSITGRAGDEIEMPAGGILCLRRAVGHQEERLDLQRFVRRSAFDHSRDRGRAWLDQFRTPFEGFVGELVLTAAKYRLPLPCDTLASILESTALEVISVAPLLELRTVRIQGFSTCVLCVRNARISSTTIDRACTLSTMWIMVAGPYKSGAADATARANNLLALNRAAVTLFRMGHVPVIGVNMALPIIEAAGPESYDEIMMPLSLLATERCDAVLRIGGPSKGADDEVERFASEGKPVYRKLEDVPPAR